jgi:methionyl-tRNA formyltransferase
MGTPEFAVPSLELIQRKFGVAAVVTAPDKPAGRGLELRQSPVKEYALKCGIPVLQPENLKEPQFISRLVAFQADLQVVVAFRMLPEQVWNMPPLGTYNLHASLLPKYRGAAPIQRAVMNGETETGMTVFRIVKEIDSGSILMQEAMRISRTMTGGELHDKMKIEGAELLVRAIERIAGCGKNEDCLGLNPQNEKEASLAPKISKQDCRIDWNQESKVVYDQVRGLSPFPGAYSVLQLNEKQFDLKIFRCIQAEVIHGIEPGRIETDNHKYLRVGCLDGMLDLHELQLAGKKRMEIDEFLRGFRFSENTRFLN